MAEVGNISREQLDKFKFMIGEQIMDASLTVDKNNTDAYELNREMNDVFTKFVTQHFFSEEAKLVKFIKLITTTFDREIAKYISYYKNNGLTNKSIMFVYKGGNILKFYMSFITHQYPSGVSDILYNFYSPHFKRSDADFSIYIDPKIPNYDKVFTDIKHMTYMILSEFKYEFLNNVKDYFDLFNLDLENHKILLSELLTDLKNTESGKKEGIQNVGFEHKRGVRQDCIIRKKENAIVNLINNDPSKKTFYISINESLSFATNNGLTEFNLIRMKATVLGILAGKKTKLINGELIDVSLPTKNDTGLLHLFNTDGIDKVFTRINYKDNNNNNNDFSFNTYSIYYLIEDLENMLFHMYEYPWGVPKYSKRINRLMFLYFADLLDNKKGGDLKQMHNIILSIRSALNEYNSKLNQPNVNPEETLKLKNTLETNGAYFKQHKYLIYDILIDMRDLLAKKDAIGENIKDFIKVILANIDVFVNAFNGLFTYLKNNGRAPTTPQTVDFMGGSLDKNGYNKFYEDKYLSYKQKYLELKSVMHKN
jgi:hypothetical protein